MDVKKYVGILVRNGEKCLLCKRNNEGSFPGLWSLPAGKIEKNEKSKDAAIREFKEETDIYLEKEKLEFRGLLPRFSRDNTKVKGFMFVYEYDTKKPLIPDLENAVDGEEHTECGYFNWNEIKKLETGEHLKNFIKNIIEN